MRTVSSLAITSVALLVACNRSIPPSPPPPDAGHPAVCFPRVNGPAHLDIDVVTGTVSGTVTINGAQLPDSPPPASASDPNQRGYLVLTDAHGATYELPLGRSGPAHFSGLLFGGTYTVQLRTERDAQLVGLPKGVVTTLPNRLTVTGDQQVDLDFTLATVSGTVTLDGNTWPDASVSRGRVTFNDTTTGSRYQFDVGATGPAQYQGAVFGGAYDVTFVGGSSFAPFPAYAPVLLEKGRTVAHDGASGYDVQRLAVSGTITLAGAALPDSPMLTASARGTVVFTDVVTLENYIFPVGVTGPGHYSGTVPKGTFKVRFLSIDDPNLVGLPRHQSALLSETQDVFTATTLDYDLTLAAVSGTVTLGGATLPDSPALPSGVSRGYVVFTPGENDGDEAQIIFGVGATGPGHYSGQVFAGTYDVGFVVFPGDVVGLPSGLPGILERGVPLSGARAHDYDLELVNLSVTVALDGGDFQDGGVRVADPVTEYETNLAPGPGGSLQTPLFSGKYDLTLSLGGRGEIVLQKQLDVHPGLAPLTYPAVLSPVSGTLTLNGKPIPDGPRGSLIFAEEQTRWPAPVEIDPSGPALFHGSVLGALYDVRLLSDVNGPQVGMPSSVLSQIAAGCADQP